MNQKGISLMALIITIIVIIILTSIIAVRSNDILKKSERMTIEEDLRNVEELVGIQKAKIMAGQVELTDKYVATDEQIDSFGNVLSENQIFNIKKINNNSERPAINKYHLMNQAAFDDVFGVDVNVRNVKGAYLINFIDKIIIVNENGKLYYSGDIISLNVRR